MDDQRARIVERVRKLLALAGDSAAAEGEIENALAFAARLMSEHDIGESETAPAEPGGAAPDPDAPIDTADYTQGRAPGGSRNAATWEGRLAMFVADLIGGLGVYRDHAKSYSVRGIRQTNPDGTAKLRSGMMFYGHAEGVALALELFAETRLMIGTIAARRYGGLYKGSGREYCEGFVQGLKIKLDADRAAERQGKARALPDPTGQTTALVPLQADQRHALDRIHRKRKNAASDWLRSSEGIKLGSSSRRRGGQYDGAARGAGQRDGRNHNASATRSRKLT